MQRILAFSGRMQSGKNTACNFIFGMELMTFGIVKKFSMTPEGQLYIYDLWGDTKHEGVFDPFNRNPNVEKFMEEEIFPYVKVYSFADILKKNVCVDLMGLPYELVYGDQIAKNTPTKYRWCDMPMSHKIANTTSLRKQHRENENFMTVREVLQYVGTEVFRHMNDNIHAEATLKKIFKDESLTALICDCRFPNEVEHVKLAGGRTIRLTRNWDVPSEHMSELALDANRYDWANFDGVVDNKNLTIIEQNIEVSKLLAGFGWENYR